MRKWAWLAVAVVALVVLVAGATRSPTEGTSDDRMFAIAGLVVAFRRWGERGVVAASDDDRELVDHALHGDEP